MASALARLGRPTLTLAIALAIAALVIGLTGGEPLAAMRALLEGAFGSGAAILRSLAKATPLILAGLAVAVALRAGLFNIGAEGQLLVGAMASAWMGFAVKGMPLFIHLPLALAAGAAAGAIWAAIAGLLRAWQGTHEVIVTIMLNYVAINLTHLLVSGPLKDHSTLASATPKVQQTARLWSLQDDPSRFQALSATNFSAGFAIALLAVLVVWFIYKRTAYGFQLKATGEGPEVAATTGVPVKRVIVSAMALSGALAGLAGSVEVLGVHRRFLDAFSPGYGFDSIAVALLAGGSPIGVALSAIAFGGLSSGSLQMELVTDTPRQVAGIIQAVVILGIGARYVRRTR